MKNIFIILFIVTTFFSCSNDKTQQDNTIPSALLGTWQFKGIYAHDVEDEYNMPQYTPYENGSLITYLVDNTFTQILEDVSLTGTYSVINGNKLVLSYNPNQIGLSTEPGSSKIYSLSEDILKLTCFDEGLCDIVRYEKVE